MVGVGLKWEHGKEEEGKVMVISRFGLTLMISFTPWQAGKVVSLSIDL